MVRYFVRSTVLALFSAVLFAIGCTAYNSGGNDNRPADTADISNPDVRMDVQNDVSDDGRPDIVAADDGNQPIDEGQDVFVGDDGISVDDHGADAREIIVPRDVPPDSDACIPNCGNRVCGDDGCGGDCGYCGYGEVCVDATGQCKTMCIPDCIEKGKECGDDGCQGSCAPGCGVNYKCGIDFKCHPDVCQPDCVEKGKECGENGCGGSCGECGESQVCSVGGLCAAGACFGIDKERNTCSLDRQYLYICTVTGTTESLLKMDCHAKSGPECGTRGCECNYNVWSGMNECIEKPPCVPDCTGKECGDDGCGGQCDICSGGWQCTNQFKCRPFAGADCVWVDWIGTCWSDNWLYTCSSDEIGQGSILAENCTAQSKVCSYSVARGQYACQ